MGARCRLALACAALAISGGAADAAERIFDFATMTMDQAPPGFTNTVTGQGAPGDWKIMLADFPSELTLRGNAAIPNRRPVLAQTAQDPTDDHFPLLIYNVDEYDDFTFETRFKLAAGKVERMAGLAFRIQDAKNYYVVRASGLGGNFAFYYFKDGKLGMAPMGQKFTIEPDAWHTMSVEARGSEFTCRIDGKLLLSTLNDKTFAHGRVGFWTKSDAVTYFADAKLAYVPREVFAQVLVRDMKTRYPRVLGLKISSYTGKGQEQFRVRASLEPAEIGHDGDPVEKEVIAKGKVCYGVAGGEVSVALPLHDRNGEVIASVRVRMKSFAGELQSTGVARALPIVKAIEARLNSGRDLFD